MPRVPDELAHTYRAAVLHDPLVDDGYMKHYVPIPARVMKKLEGVDRVWGRLDDVTFRRSVQRRPNGEPCLKFGEGWLKDAGFEIGQVVRVGIDADPDPDHVEIPEELELAFAEAPDAAHLWTTLTPGKRRTMVYALLRAKRAETRRTRAAKLVDELRRMIP